MTSVSEADLDYLLLAHVISVSEYFTGHRTAKDYYSISTSAQSVDAMQADINSYICCNTALTDRRSRFRMRTEMRLYDMPSMASRATHRNGFKGNPPPVVVGRRGAQRRLGLRMSY